MIKKFKMYKKCLIVVDMVNGFVRSGVLHDEEISRVIPRQIKLIKEAQKEESLVIFIKDTHSKESKEFKRFGDTCHCLEGTSESQVVDELKPFENMDNTISIEKNSTSFMEAPKFRNVIEKLENIKEYNIIGCCTDICVMNGSIGLANYLDEWNSDAQVIVHKDAIATYAEKERQNYVEAAYLLMEQQGIKLVKKR